MIMTGLSIGCVISVKWVGFFVTALVGLYTAEDLWEKVGDLRMPKVGLRVLVMGIKLNKSSRELTLSISLLVQYA